MHILKAELVNVYSHIGSLISCSCSAAVSLSKAFEHLSDSRRFLG